MKPSDAHALADRKTRRAVAEGLYRSDDLVSGNDAVAFSVAKPLCGRQLALDLVKVGPTHAANTDAYQQLTFPGRRVRGLDDLERPLFHRPRFT